MLSAFTLKIVAVVTMLIDHAGLVLYYSKVLPWSTLYVVMRAIGRTAFPLYAFFLVNGFDKTKDRAKYLTRLCVFAVISQVPYSFSFYRFNYSSPKDIGLFRFRHNVFFYIVIAIIVVAFFLEGRKRKLLPLFAASLSALFVSQAHLIVRGRFLLYADLNIFYTLACSLSIIWVVDLLRNWKEHSVLSLITAVVTCAAVSAFLMKNIDYGWKGPLLVGMLYLTKSNQKLQALMAALWGVIAHLGLSIDTWMFCAYFAGVCLAAVGILLYSGEQGRKSRVFYYVYPVHIALFGAICQFFFIK